MLIDLRLGDCLIELKKLPDCSVQMCVTSPPYYGLRDYGIDGQIGLEETPETYVQKLVGVFGEVKRVLKDDGTLWLNLGDSYVASQAGNKDKSIGFDGRPRNNLRESNKALGIIDKTKLRGLKQKDLMGIPWRVAFALQSDGWYLRQDIIWHKPNPMPESVTDRCTKAHEYIFLLAKSQKYYFDNEAIKEPQSENTFKRYKPGEKIPSFKKEGGSARKTKQWAESAPLAILPNGRNKRSVWTITTKPFREAHFATFPEDLIKPCILAGSKKGDVVLDPFFGAGTTGVVAKKHGRDCIGIELNPEYIKMAQRRIDNTMEDMFVHPPKKE
jgi:DNA modification methylase